MQVVLTSPARFLCSGNRPIFVAKLPMLSRVAVSAQRHKVRKRIIPLLAPLDLVVDL
jgi:hypothetical protein